MIDNIDLRFLDDLNVTSINTVDDHSEHEIYIGEKENKVILNGKWKFAYFQKYINEISYLLSPTFDISSFSTSRIKPPKTKNLFLFLSNTPDSSEKTQIVWLINKPPPWKGRWPSGAGVLRLRIRLGICPALPDHQCAFLHL